ncbi:hypothetical protein KEG38_51815 [Polyangium jinanense]|uniref:hypothetical protein n=1 Tax=Polyangium jinanense TaxID=2829994 RepID=UPI0023425367|nr:hypothetical protein [Polyangium jinanense]MDC3962411.1 hypothetical protein [Polyangium jinanense]
MTNSILLPLTTLALSTTLAGCFLGDSTSVEEAAIRAARIDFTCDTFDVTPGLTPMPADGEVDADRQDVLVSGCGRSAIYACSRSEFTRDWYCSLTDQAPR